MRTNTDSKDIKMTNQDKINQNEMLKRRLVIELSEFVSQ